MPASQDRSVSLIPDPQTRLQPQVRLHLETRSSHSVALCRFSQNLIRSHLTLITVATLSSTRVAICPRHQSVSGHQSPSPTCARLHLPLNEPADAFRPLFVRSAEDNACHTGCYSKNICFLSRPSLVTPAAFACGTADWTPGVYLEYQHTGRFL